ncbi:hypothetical protein HDU97_001420 [Phlyctochytrium planicorne]|nr:hypothetical protein HDU97_001420 [Phlyctochytrium planicorne]
MATLENLHQDFENALRLNSTLSEHLSKPHPTSWPLLRSKFELLGRLESSKSYLDLLLRVHDLDDLIVSTQEDGRKIPKVLEEFEDVCRRARSLKLVKDDGEDEEGIVGKIRFVRDNISKILEKSNNVSEPVKSMVKLLIATVKFHFKDKETSRIDKPEWFLSHVLKTMQSHAPFFTSVLQPLLASYPISAVSILVHEMTAFASKRILKDAIRVVSDADSFAHILSECKIFDGKIVSAFPTVENDIKLVTTLVEDGKQHVTDRIACLPPTHQIEFFEKSQKPCVQTYLEQSRKYLEGLDNQFIPISQDGSHVKATETRLVKVCGIVTSMAYLSKVFALWDQEIIYLEMWLEITSLWKNQVKEAWGDSVFDFLIRDCKSVLTDANSVLDEFAVKEFTESFWLYDKKRNWSNLTGEDVEDVSPEFIPVLETVQRILQDFRENLDPRSFKNVVRKWAKEVESHIVRRVILRNHFSPVGAKQFEKDIFGNFSKLFASVDRLSSNMIGEQVPETPEPMEEDFVDAQGSLTADEMIAKYPSRIRQLSLLRNIIEWDDHFKQTTVPCMYAYGPPSSGKTSIFRDAFASTRHVFINCMEYSSTSGLCSAILAGIATDKARQAKMWEKRVGLVDFAKGVKSLLEDQEETVYVILDNAEQLRNLTPATAFPALLRLQEAEFYTNFIDIVLQIFYPITTDINELSHVFQILFRKYDEPVQDGRATMKETTKLYQNLQFFIKAALDRLFSPDLSDILDMHVQSNTLTTTKPSGMNAKKSILGTRKKKERQQLLGPKAFPMERMLAIFRSIVKEEGVVPRKISYVDTLTQIATLESSRLLKRASPADRFDDLKYKCMATFDFVARVAKSHDFDISKYLFEFK